MANHFRSAVQKLSSQEVSALTSTLVAIIKAHESGNPPSNTAQVVDAFINAVESNGRDFQWVDPSGGRHPTAQKLIEETILNETGATIWILE